MHIIYNGISLSPVAGCQIQYEVVTDETQCDLCYLATQISGEFIVNGQVGVRNLDDPPTSYRDSLNGVLHTGSGPIESGSAVNRTTEAVINRPPLFPAPSVGSSSPINTENANRQLGAAIAYGPPDFIPYNGNLSSPAYAAEISKVAQLIAAPIDPTVTMQNIYLRLTEPRGQLFVYEEGGAPANVLIHSPGFDMHCDAKNGPTPQLLALYHSQGEGTTFFVQWHCTTYLRKQQRSSIIDPLLSNRWTMTHHIRNGGFTDVEVEGVAHFDVGLLHKLQLNPDTYRPQLLLPIPFGYERSDIIVTESADGCSVHYHFIDHQVEIFFPAGVYVGATEIDVEHKQYCITDDDVLSGALGTVDSFLNRRWLGDQAVASPTKKVIPIAKPIIPKPGPTVTNYQSGMQPPKGTP